MSLVERIQMLATQQGISIKHLESECGLGNGTIGRWNTKNGPALGSLMKVAKYLHVSIQKLTTGEDISGPTPPELTPGEQAVFEQIHSLSEAEKFKLAGALPFIRMMQEAPVTLNTPERERATVGLFKNSTSRE